MLVFGGVYEWHRELNYVSPFHLYNFSNPPTLHIEFVLETFHPPPFPSFHKRGAGGLTQPRTVRFFLWFFQLLNCTVANAQLKTKQLVLHDWSYWFQTVPTSHRLFCYIAKLRPSHEFLSTKNSCPTLTTGRRCVSSKNYGKIKIKKKRVKWYSNQVWLHGHSVIPIKKKMRLWNWAILESRMCTISETMMQRIMRLNIPPESLTAIFIGLLVSMLYFIISFWIGSWSEVSWNRNTYSYASMISTIYLHIHTMSF